MKRSSFYLLPTLLILTTVSGLSGCAALGKKYAGDDDDSQKKLQTQVQEMRDMLLKMNSKLDSFDEKFASINDKLNQSSIVLDSLNKKETRLKQLAIEKPSRREPTPTSVNGHPTLGQGAHVMAHVSSNDPSGGIVDNEVVQAYRRAKILFDSGKLSEAILEFSAFVSDYADHPLASQAQYSIGECYFQQKEYKLASEELKRVLVSYENSSAIPDTLKRLSQSQEKLGLVKEANKTRQTLITLYPSSPAAKAIAQMKTEEENSPAQHSSHSDLPPAADVIPKNKPLVKPPVASIKRSAPAEAEEAHADASDSEGAHE